jgi:DNA-binding NarL/FixJ family response regulator
MQELGEDPMFAKDAERGVFGASGGPGFGDEPAQELLQVAGADDGSRRLDQAREAINDGSLDHRPGSVPLPSYTMGKLKVLLVDDHEVVRAGIKALLDAEEDIVVVGEAGTVAEGVRRVGYDEPDVVVLDVRLPDGSGVEACRDIRSRFPEVKVLMLTSFADEDALMSAILAGASGYVLKRVKMSDLVDDIRRVGAGESLLDPDMTERLFSRLRSGPQDDPLLAKLSKQERTIVAHIADGLTNKQIAEEMFLAEKTVKNYVSNLLTKMGMSRRSEAAAYVARLEAEHEGAESAQGWGEG